MKILIIALALWFASALYRGAKKSKRENEARITALEKGQEKERKEREAADAKLAKEQERQAQQLAKHEKRIADLEYRVSQAESDIEFLNGRIAQLDAQRDYLLLQQSGTVPGGKEHTKFQAKIVSIENQIHTAENKLSKAQHIKEMAAKELSA